MSTQNHPTTNDPHASKIAPDDPRLKLTRPTGKTLKKGPIFAIGLSTLGVVLFAFTVALSPNNAQSITEAETTEPTPQQLVIPEIIRNAPALIESEPEPEVTPESKSTVPQLGPKLPGDLGAPMVASASKQQTQLPNAYSTTSPEQQLEQEALTADPYWNSGASMMQNPTTTHASEDLNHIMGQLQNSDSSWGNLTEPNHRRPPSEDGVARQNRQGEKKAFIAGAGQKDNNYLKGQLSQPRSPYEVKAGAIIPVTLITGINSDLPGEIIGQVRENVYDTVTGNHLLIPQGSRLMASYDSAIAFGQERVLVCWNRLIRPDGSSINLECAPGIDLAGYAGFKDQVDHHWWRLATGVIFSSLLAATATTSQGDITDSATFDQVFAANVGEEINNVGQQITQKNLNIQPTLKIRPGFSVNVLVNKDVILTPYG